MGCLHVFGQIVYEFSSEQLYYLSSANTVTSYHIYSNSFQPQIQNSPKDVCWIETFPGFGFVTVGNDCQSVWLDGNLLFSTVCSFMELFFISRTIRLGDQPSHLIILSSSPLQTQTNLFIFIPAFCPMYFFLLVVFICVEMRILQQQLNKPIRIPVLLGRR